MVNKSTFMRANASYNISQAVLMQRSGLAFIFPALQADQQDLIKFIICVQSACIYEQLYVEFDVIKCYQHISCLQVLHVL